MNEFICMGLIAIVMLILGFVIGTIDKNKSRVINFIKSFIRWHRK